AGIPLDLSEPCVMGILNISEDSFYDGGSFTNTDAQLQHVEQMLLEGASVIDIGAMSTRPGSTAISENEEAQRIATCIAAVKKHFPECIVSVDTYRASIARIAFQEGAGMLNDISGGTLDERLLETVSQLGIP